MTSLGAAIFGLALLSFGVPAWLFAIAALRVTSRPISNSSDRCFNYLRVVDRILDELDAEKNRAFAIIIGVRELRSYPEYKDVTIALLSVIEITGKGHNEFMMIEEIKATESALLNGAMGAEAARPRA